MPFLRVFGHFLECEAQDSAEIAYLDSTDHYLQLSNWSHVHENSFSPFFGQKQPFLGFSPLRQLIVSHTIYYQLILLSLHCIYYQFILLSLHYIYYQFIAFTISSLHLLSVSSLQVITGPHKLYLLFFRVPMNIETNQVLKSKNIPLQGHVT